MKRSIYSSARLVLGLTLIAAAVQAPAGAQTEPPTAARGKILFSSDRDGDFEIYVINADGTGLKQLTFNRRADLSPDWAPGGRRIVFSRSRKNGMADLMGLRLKDRHKRWLTKTKQLTEFDAAWSPTGRWIAFTVEDAGGDGSDVAAIRKEGTRRRTIAHQEENTLNQDPAWSPDGRMLATVEAHETTFLHIRRFPSREMVRALRLEGKPWNAVNPAWSPDGTTLLYSRNDEPEYPDDATGLLDYDLFALAVEGEENRLVEEPSDTFAGTWSPCDERIAFFSDREGSLDLFVAAADGSDAVRLTDWPGTERDPEWFSRCR